MMTRRVLCAARYAGGLSFTFADMRWGIRELASDRHDTVDICLSEIRRCQRSSVGPQFVTFLGDKYGFQPFPARVDQTVFELLLGAVAEDDDVKKKKKEHRDDDNNGDGDGNDDAASDDDDDDDSDASLLRTWFRLDSNVVPPAYRLRYISDVYPGGEVHKLNSTDP